MTEAIVATCKDCGAPHAVVPGQVPPCGGTVAAREDRVRGWEILEFVCGPCWAQRARTWTCTACGGEGFEGANFCSACHSVSPDPRHFVDEEAHTREEEELALPAWRAWPRAPPRDDRSARPQRGGHPTRPEREQHGPGSSGGSRHEVNHHPGQTHG